ncbi:MAG: replication initiation protein [Desulfamplus sp.]|nr:replication initiation protein [Desulfamplus sp.]
MQKKDVIKHSAAIQISNKISLLERRTWNVLLANAFDDMDKTDRYKISVRELAQILKYDSKDVQYLKNILYNLVDTTVEWNILEKDHKEWGVFTLLSGVNIVNGYCLYRYDPVLREYLHNPSMYARISLSLQNQFGSKYALVLFELFADYFQIKRGYGETPWISLEHLRELMGVKEEEYKEFKSFKKRVIKEPIEEINAITDLSINLKDGILTKTEGRKIVALKFIIHKNKNNIIDIQSIEKKQCTEQLCLPLPEFDIDNQELLNILITEFSIPSALATQILKTKDEYQINEKLNEIRKQVELSGYILDKSDLALKAFFPKTVGVSSSSAASSTHPEIDDIEKRLRSIGFHTFKKVRRQHSDQVLLDAFKELDFEIERRKKMGESIDNLGGWLRIRLPESGQSYVFSNTYTKHLEKEAARKKAKERLEQEDRARAEALIKHDEHRKAFHDKIDKKIAALKEQPSEWEALEKEALEKARSKIPVPNQVKLMNQLVVDKFKNLNAIELQGVSEKAVSATKSFLSNMNIDINSQAFQKAVENQKLEIVKTVYAEELNQLLHTTSDYITFQRKISAQTEIEIRNLVAKLIEKTVINS